MKKIVIQLAIILFVAGCGTDDEILPELEFHDNAWVIEISSNSEALQSLEIRERCDLDNQNCQVVNVTCNYSDPEFRFDLVDDNDWLTSYFVQYGFFSNSSENVDANTVDMIRSADYYEILAVDYGPEPNSSYGQIECSEPNNPDSCVELPVVFHRYFRVGSHLSVGDVNTLRELEFRAVKDGKIIFYLHFKE